MEDESLLEKIIKERERKAEIRRQINELNGEIRKLEAERNEYEKMNKNIVKSQEELKEAIYSSETALTNFRNFYYESDLATMKQTDIANVNVNMDTINILLNAVLEESNEKKEEIKGKITEKQNAIDILRSQL